MVAAVHQGLGIPSPLSYVVYSNCPFAHGSGHQPVTVVGSGGSRVNDFQIGRTGRIEPEEWKSARACGFAENGGKDGTPSDEEPKWKAFSTLR